LGLSGLLGNACHAAVAQQRVKDAQVMEIQSLKAFTHETGSLFAGMASLP
jgi:hypothetical protein